MKKNVKRTAVIFMAILMLVTAMPLNGIVGTDLFANKASAAELAPTGQCGENVYWMFDSETGLLTISGTGETYDYSGYSNSPFYYQSSIKRVIVESDITNIGDGLFKYCTYLNEIILPDSVTCIGANAFNKCSALKSIDFPANLTEIQNGAFWESGLINIYLPEGLKSIEANAFRGCFRLETVNISKNVNKIEILAFADAKNLTGIFVSDDNEFYFNDSFGVLYEKQNNTIVQYPAGRTEENYEILSDVYAVGDYAFYKCLNLKSVLIPNGVQKIGEDAFCQCKNIEYFNLPDSVNEIGPSAFCECEKAQHINIPKGVTCINNNTFLFCKALENITIPDGVTKIGFQAFRNCILLSSIVIPESVSNVDKYAFESCSGLTKVILPAQLKSLRSNVFGKCGMLSEIELPANLETIGEAAFLSCVSLESLNMPRHVKSIEKQAFYNCIGLKNVNYSGSRAQWNHIEISGNNENLTNAIISYADDEYDNFFYRIENGNAVITGYFGENANNLFLPEMIDGYMVTGIDSFSFEGFDKMSYIEIPDCVKNIGTNAFSGCTGLKEVYLGENTTVVGENAFADCTNLSIVSVTSDYFNAENAFKNNSSKLTFVISENNTAAESFAKNNGYSVITAGCSADSNTIDFKGNTVVYKGLKYNYLTNYINKYSDAEYIHFDRLEFDGVMPDIILIEDCENIASGVKNFALDDLYVSLKVVIDGQEEQITFEKMFELLESGNYDAFKLKFNSESGETEESFFEKIEEFFVGFYTSALRVITKAINFVVGLFKKK